MRLALVLLALAAPAAALAQDVEKLEACIEGVDMEALGDRILAFTDTRGVEARVAGLGAGDRDAAAAYAREVEAEFYAQDPETSALRACLEEAGYFAALERMAPHVCDIPPAP